jgi:3'(2'), 5'-bisphosphate nucleotidase
MDSSIKLCRIAEGAADIYVRHGPTMEWDIAAGHAVLEAAGGTLTTPGGAPFVYGKATEGFRNGHFVARGAPSA